MFRFEDNWFDTLDALKEIDDETYEKLKIPLKLVQVIKGKLQKTLNNSDQIKKAPTQESGQSKKENDHNLAEDKEKPKIQEKSMINELNKICMLLEELKKMIPFKENLKNTLTLLKTIVGNIANNPSNQAFRRIKLSNKKFSDYIVPFPPALDLLKYVRGSFNLKQEFR